MSHDLRYASRVLLRRTAGDGVGQRQRVPEPFVDDLDVVQLSRHVRGRGRRTVQATIQLSHMTGYVVEHHGDTRVAFCVLVPRCFSSHILILPRRDVVEPVA
jgi:hypothetical protein